MQLFTTGRTTSRTTFWPTAAAIQLHKPNVTLPVTLKPMQYNRVAYIRRLFHHLRDKQLRNQRRRQREKVLLNLVFNF